MVGQVSKGQPDSSSVISLTTARMYIDGRQAKSGKELRDFYQRELRKGLK